MWSELLRVLGKMGGWMTKLGPHIVYVEGNIGAGKTELLGELEKHGYTVVREAIDEDWTLFERYKKDPKRWCTVFQLQVSLSITKRIEDAVKGHRGPWPIFVERSILSAYLFAKVAKEVDFLSATELEIVREFSRMLNQRFDGYIQHTLFLECPVDTCLERIKKRGRKGEEKIDKDYLNQIQAAYQEAKESDWVTINAMQMQRFVLLDVLKQIEQ